MNDEPYTGDTSYRLPRAEIAGCTLVQDLLPLYLDGEVSPESHAVIADHLERCERCSGFLAGARSVRAQILDEESKVRAAFATSPAVAAVQQPVWSSPLATLWRFAMLMVWLCALALTFMGVLDGAPEGLVIGGGGTLAAIGGLLIAGGEQRVEWRLGMLLTGLLGIFCLVGGLFGGFGYGLSGPIAVGGTMQLVIAAWGLWPHRPRPSVQSVAGRSGSEQPMLTALLSLAGVAVSAALLLAGIAMVSSAQSTFIAAPPVAWAQDFSATDGDTMMFSDPALVAPAMPQRLDSAPARPVAPRPPADVLAVPVAPDVALVNGDVMIRGGLHWEPLVLGTALIGAAIAGLLVIAGRRGWLPRELRSLGSRRWLGYGLVGVGLLWLSLALRAMLAGLLPSLPAAGIAAALLLLGWALARRSPPPEEPRVL